MLALKTLRLETPAPLRLDGLRFLPKITKLDISLRPKPPHEQWYDDHGVRLEDEDYKIGQLLNLQHIKHLRIDCRIREIDADAKNWFHDISPLVSGFTKVHEIEFYAEPTSYNHALDGALFILPYEFQYEDSLGVKSHNGLVQMFLPLRDQLQSLALSGGFWAIDPDDPLDSQASVIR